MAKVVLSSKRLWLRVADSSQIKCKLSNNCVAFFEFLAALVQTSCFAQTVAIHLSSDTCGCSLRRGYPSSPLRALSLVQMLPTTFPAMSASLRLLCFIAFLQ
ncbi:unnamed protein product [Symbiodinium sp. CCMP2456]|nr:unnamed protein product [Symbiodinium sp. CCMP2456]